MEGLLNFFLEFILYTVLYFITHLFFKDKNIGGDECVMGIDWNWGYNDMDESGMKKKI